MHQMKLILLMLPQQLHILMATSMISLIWHIMHQLKTISLMPQHLLHVLNGNQHNFIDTACHTTNEDNLLTWLHLQHFLLATSMISLIWHGASSENYLADVVAMVACHHHNQHDFIDRVCHASSEDNFANPAAPTVCCHGNQHDFIDMAHGASSEDNLLMWWQQLHVIMATIMISLI